MVHMNDYVKLAIHGVPRSGTSWIGEIVNSSPNVIYRFQPLFSYAHKDFLTNSSSKEEIDQFFEKIQKCNDDFTNQKEKRKLGDFPTFKKDKITHVAYKEVRYINILFNLLRKSNDVIFCGVIRNPLAVINSWLKAPREFRLDLGWSELYEWRYAPKKNLNKPEEFNGYEKWKEAANIFIQLKKQFPCRVYILSYSKILKNTLEETEMLFSFLNLPVTDQTYNFIKNSTLNNINNAYAVYRKTQDDDKWKKELDTTISQSIIDDLSGTHLENFINL